MKKILLFWMMFLSRVVFAGGGEDTAGFVNLAKSVKAVGMGGAYMAIGQGIDALYYNPAGLGSLGKKEILLGYTRHFADISFSSIAYGQPILKGVGGINIFLMNTSGGEEANTSGKTGKEVDVSCRLISVSYATKFSSSLNLGGSIKSINQNYAGYKGNKFAYDLGILGKFEPLSLGFSLNNLGGDVEIDKVKNSLPFNVKAGLGYKILESILFAIDIEKPKASSFIFHLGTEYKLLPNIDLRGGYDSISGYSLGFGIRSHGSGRMQNVLGQIDYALLYNPDLTSSHRVSLLTRF